MSLTVAIVGASSDRSKFGNKSVRAHRDSGYEVFPVNPAGGMIEELFAYVSVADIPSPLTRVSMYVPPHVGEKLIGKIAEKGCEELWLNPGTASPELVERAKQLGLNVIQGCSIVDLNRSPADYP